MNHYYQELLYTTEQAKHANDVVYMLLTMKRFFLHGPNDRDRYYQQDYVLDPEVFGESIDLDASLQELYSKARDNAVDAIVKGERELGFQPPYLGGNRQIAVCNRYGGGFSICRVYPLTAFLPCVPETFEDLVTEHYENMIGDQSVGDITPNTLREYEKEAFRLASKVWTELQNMKIWDKDNVKCVVMLESKTNRDGDLGRERVENLQEYPFAMGYLFWKFSQTTRIVQHNHVIFSTSRRSHVNVYHWSEGCSDDRPRINYGASGGYDCKVVFVTIL